MFYNKGKNMFLSLTTKKTLITFLTIIVSILTSFFFIALLNTLANQSIFANEVFITFFIGVLIYCCYLKIRLFNTYEKIMISFFSMSLIFIAGVFGPVFIDRSISYQIVMAAAENKSITLDTLLTTARPMYQKRLTELETLGLLSSSTEKTEPTAKGRFVAKSWLIIGRLTKTRNEYKNFKSLLDKNSSATTNENN